MSTPDGTGHTWPWLLECQNPLDIISVDLLARDWVNNRRLNSEEWERCRSRLGWGNASKRSDNVGTGLSLPVCLDPVSIFHLGSSHCTYIDNVGFLLSNDFEIPFPNFSRNWLTDGTQNTEMLHLRLDVLVTSPLE